MLPAQPYQFLSSVETTLAGQQQKAVLLWVNVTPVPQGCQEFVFEPKFSSKEGNWRPTSLEGTDILWDILVQKC